MEAAMPSVKRWIPRGIGNSRQREGCRGRKQEKFSSVICLESEWIDCRIVRSRSRMTGDWKIWVISSYARLPAQLLKSVISDRPNELLAGGTIIELL